ncbi:hypothetical protein P9314_04700 [Paenibacillus validus]|uniref:Uncharacterized protein n=1 Tax=Paenibacillus chartarius TaxID=747481 RepID=A0ABV6DMG8_9BACL|nr:MULTISPECIES: hypothetical protein [Paenibacillus]MED4600007.1 hypothetical protein [Paenibacillus validus]MED4605726.1 hypothetical protein [Paenibacillus validus]
MKIIVLASLEDNEATLKSVLESKLIKESQTIQAIKIDQTIADICVINSANPNVITRPILTIIEIGGE